MSGCMKLAAWFLVLFTWFEPVWAVDLPITITLPNGCSLQVLREGDWACDYERQDGAFQRNRKLVLGFHTVTLQPSIVARLKTMSEKDVETTVNAEITGIDKRREASLPAGDYKKAYYNFLSANERPKGFASCVRYLDALVPDGSNIKNDRAHLHCWSIDLINGTASQLLLSTWEYNPPTRPVSVGLEEEFSAIITSVTLD